MIQANIVVVGCGHWGKNLIRNFHQLGRLYGVVDANPATSAAKAAEHDVLALTFEQALGDQNVLGVVIATPAETHCELAIAAFAAGKHVFVEKPIALSVADGEAMQAAAIRANRQLMVGHLLQFHPTFVKLLEMVRSGELGNIRYAYSNRLSLGKFRTEENVLWSFAAHDLSALLAIFDEEPLSTSVSGTAWMTPGIEDENRIDLEFSGGRRAHVFVSWLHPFKEQRMVIVGDKAMVVFEDTLAGEDKLKIYRHQIKLTENGPVPIAAPWESVSYPNLEPLRQECLHFIETCASNTPPLTDANEALRVLRVLMAG